MRLFCDMDGVLADFDRHYENVFGVCPNKLTDNVAWDAVRAHKDFYLNIPPMPDMQVLWDYIGRVGLHSPTILTGIPSSVDEAAENKIAWVRKHLGPQVSVICCPSKEKCLHAKPGDILIDDWIKYKHLWEEKSGRWVTHTSAEDTIKQLFTMGIGL